MSIEAEPAPWPMGEERGAGVRHTSWGVFQGKCSPMFEGQTFVPQENAQRKYWLNLSEAEHASLMQVLQPLGWHEWNLFELEFRGRLYWVGSGCGHLGMSGGIADVEQIISVRFTAPPSRREPGPPLGIRGLIERYRASAKSRT